MLKEKQFNDIKERTDTMLLETCQEILDSKKLEMKI